MPSTLVIIQLPRYYYCSSCQLQSHFIHHHGQLIASTLVIVVVIVLVLLILSTPSSAEAGSTGKKGATQPKHLGELI